MCVIVHSLQGVSRSFSSTRISDHSDIGTARRAALVMAGAEGFSEVDTGRVAIAAAVTASNLLRSGGGGEILLRPSEGGIEMLAIAGHPDALRNDIFNALSRLTSISEIYHNCARGTVLAARFYPCTREPVRCDPLEIGAAQAASTEETSCGDAWAYEGGRLLMAEGLGHGFQAALAAKAAVEVFERYWHFPPAETVAAIHRELASTSGAAVAVVETEPDIEIARFCGVGSIGGFILAEETVTALTSYRGAVGHEVDRIAQIEYSWPVGALLILHSAGISTHCNLGDYPGLAMRHPSLIAAVLYRDYRRMGEDATVVVARDRMTD